MIGIRKASVLPVPVCAVASTSLPSSAGGIADAWTGVGVVKCECASFCWSPADRGMSLNCVKRFFLSWRGVSRGGPPLSGYHTGALCTRWSSPWRASREDTTEATLVLFGAETETEAGKAGNRIEVRIGCRLQAAVANKRLLVTLSQCAGK